MLNRRPIHSILILLFLSTTINAEPLLGTAGSMAYYSNELGKFGVGSGEAGPDGSLTYAYPMGIVTAVYNSSAGRWMIGQTSAISREMKWGAPQYTDNDIYLLDGVELVYASGTNPKLYHARKENYAKIEYFNPGLPDSYWKITSTDGGKRYYGNTTDSRIEAIGRPVGQPRVWALAKMEDAGNFSFTRYYYDEDTAGGGFYLTKLISGKTGAATNGFKATKLFYENEPNPVLSYREGSKVKTTKRPVTVLDIIGCDVTGTGGVPTSAFKISWMQTTLTHKPLVSSITQYGTDAQLDGNGLINGGSSLPPTAFEYAEFNPSFGTQQNWQSIDVWCLRVQVSFGSGLMFSMMDMNGDGLPDRIKQGYSDSGKYSDGPDYNFRVQLNTGSGFGENQVWNSSGKHLDDNWESYIPYNDPFWNNKPYDYLDINGDGLPDRVWQDNETNFHFKLNTGTDFGPEQTWSSSGNYLRAVDANGNTLSDYLDMNGDGRADRIWQGADTTLNIRFNNGHGFDAAVAWESSINFLRALTKFTLDPLHLTVSNNDNYCDYININGDGLPDRVWQKNETVLHIRFNNGNGFDPETTWASQNSYIRDTVNNAGRHPDHAISDYIDFNGDGLPDRLIQGDNNGPGNLSVALNTGNGFGNPITIQSAYSWLRALFDLDPGDYQYNDLNTCGDYLDMNGDGLLDRVWRMTYFNDMDSPFKIYLSHADAPAETFLTRVTASSGGTTEYTYTPVNRSLNPIYKMKGWVLESVTTNDGFNNLLTTTFSYAGGSYDNDERLFTGFREITAASPTGDYVKTYYHQDGPEAGLVEKQVVLIVQRVK